MIRKSAYLALGGLFFLLGGTGCKVKYSLSGASINSEVKSVSIPFFPNSAAYNIPILSATFTDALQEKFSNQTKLEVITTGLEEGDLAFSGEIVSITSMPTAITAASENPAAQNRLTITVRVKFTNRVEPEWNFDRSFSQYVDYDSNRMLSAVEGELVPIVVKALVDDIYQAAVANW